jgi:hypothetical protein
VFANVDAFRSRSVVQPEEVAAQILDIVLPPARAHVDNAIVSRATEWLGRVANKNIDRTQLTPALSTILSDDVIAHAGYAALGKPLDVIPIASPLSKRILSLSFRIDVRRKNRRDSSRTLRLGG